jgi:prophage regulatory protein
MSTNTPGETNTRRKRRAKRASRKAARQMRLHERLRAAGVDDPMLRRPQVIEMTGLDYSTIYRGFKAGTFPQPIQLGLKAIGWRKSAITHWLDARQRPSVEGDR